MVTHMKTTIDIADALLREAKQLAREQDRTLRAVVEDALRRFLADDAKEKRKVRYQRHTFGGKGVQRGIVEGRWFDLIYPPYES
jgi:Arc/MetJ family transcription regulator